jgi:hypothetical protein
MARDSGVYVFARAGVGVLGVKRARALGNGEVVPSRGRYVRRCKVDVSGQQQKIVWHHPQMHQHVLVYAGNFCTTILHKVYRRSGRGFLLGAARA